ncbi:MAG: fumarylacetoacetate hydrolase family protein [Desulfobacteraceae bacterium]|jgi:2-keto-4-pentenoate hydratase/2-oxohepta-3-ene-1,7-dioic acid hydratase in catechol pathway
MLQLPFGDQSKLYTVSPTKIIALGLNYREHIAESHSVKVSGFTQEIPKEPVLFPKTPNVLIGPDETIVIPEFLKDYNFKDLRVDYEGELALIISKDCKNVPEDAAYNVILGFTIMNDVSQRNLQTGDRSGWFRGKSLDTFGPIGPRIVPTEQIGDPQNLNIQTRLNQKVVQNANTCDMIFPIARIIAFISKNFTLKTGDIILTGTPSGVGQLHHGDTIEVEVENIGVLRNTVVEE